MTSSLPALIQTIQAAADAGASQDWTIADACAEVVGKRDGRTHQIAVSLRPQRSDDWVEDRGHAGQFFMLLGKYAPGTCYRLRDLLPFRYFTECWKVWHKDKQAFPLGTLMELLEEAVEKNTEITAFRNSLIPLAGGMDSYRKTAEKYFKKLDRDLISAPFTEVDEAKAVTVREAAIMLKDALSELLDGKAQIGAE
jgi:hypothetical protein